MDGRTAWKIRPVLVSAQEGLHVSDGIHQDGVWPEWSIVCVVSVSQFGHPRYPGHLALLAT